MSENGRGNQDDRRKQAALDWGRISCVAGLLLAIIGSVVTVLLGSGVSESITPGAIGALLGFIGYALGMGRIASVTMVVCVACLFFSLAATQGIIPGIEGTGYDVNPATK